MIEQTFWKSTKQNTHFYQQVHDIIADFAKELWQHNELNSFKKEKQELFFVHARMT